MKSRLLQHGRMPSFDVREADRMLAWFVACVVMAIVILVRGV